MIRAGLLVVAGAAAGVYGSLKAKRFAEEFTAEGLRHRARAATLGARLLREEVARGQAEAEVELRQRYDLAGEKRRALDPPDRPDSAHPDAATPDPATPDPATPTTPQEGTDRWRP